MSASAWLSAPIGIDSPRWVTRPGCRTVLAVVHTIASCGRILDVIDYVESDPRLQIVFTVAPDVFNPSLPAYLQELGALVVPWSQAVRERFDLAVAASYGGLADLHAPLMLMAHGAGRAKLLRRENVPAPADPPVYGLDAQRLTGDGAVLPAALLLSHERERDVLRRQCPEALAVATVVGDPCFDRLIASRPWRDRYRRALGVEPGQRLVVVCSTWGRDGLFGGVPDLLPRVLDQLPPAGFRVAALLHPAVWEAHGRRQVRAWTRDCREAGLILPERGDDWRAFVVAADRVIGDHGSVTAYAAGLGRPLLHLAPPGRAARAPGSPHRLLATAADRLDPDAPLLPQLRAARPVEHAPLRAALTSRPGRADALIRHEMYRLLRLAQPGRHRRPAPVPEPEPRPAARTRS
jgi:hypothetical protein